MGNFSKSPEEQLLYNLKSNYIGVHIEQGVPVLDRDLNLLADLLAARLRAVVSTYIGDGTATGNDDAFRIFGYHDPVHANDFIIGCGTYLAGGIEIRLAHADMLRYTMQNVPASSMPLLPLTTPTLEQPNPRTDIVYLDLWLDEVTEDSDLSLGNADDVGMQTSVRVGTLFLVRVAENAYWPPSPELGHSHHALARLNRPTNDSFIKPGYIEDIRTKNLTLADVTAKLNPLLDEKYAAEVVLNNRVSTSSDVMTQIEGMSLTFTLFHPSKLVIVLHLPDVELVFTGGTGVNGIFTLRVDGKDTVQVMRGSRITGPVESVFLTEIVYLTQGPHTVDAAWRTNTSTNTVSACSRGGYGNNRILQVVEL